MTAQLLSIGEVARAAGLATSAIRYYDEIGIVVPVTREGGKRRYDNEAVGRINFIRRSQVAGFSLEDIARILDDTNGAWRGLVRAKRDELAERRAQLDELITMLDEIGECGCSAVAECPAALPGSS